MNGKQIGTRKYRFIKIAAAFFILASMGFCRAAEPLPVRMFQLHANDLGHINAMYDWARELGMTGVQLSHNIVMNIDEVTVAPVIAKRFARMVDNAHQRGLKVQVWAHEFNTGNKAFCMDPQSKQGAEFWAARQEAYRKALKEAPGIDGVVLMFGSSPTEPWEVICTCQDFRRSVGNQGLVKLTVEKVRDVVVGEFGKELLLRTFIHSPDQLRWVIDGIRGMENVTVMPKDIPQDWEPYYPPDPSIADLAPMPVVVEMDLAGEYWGLGVIPYCQVDYIKRRIDYGVEHGIEGAVGRIERLSDQIKGTPNEVNVYSFARFLNDPDTTAGQVWADWIKLRYGLEPGSGDSRTLQTILDSTYDVGRKLYYTLGFWTLEKGSDLPGNARYPGLLKGRSIALYDPDYKPLEAELMAPTEETLQKIAQEKHEALYMAKRNLDMLAGLRGSLKPEDFKDLENRLHLQWFCVRVWDHVTQLVWRYMKWEKAPNDHDRGIIEWHLNELDRLAGEIEKEFGKNVLIGNPGQIRTITADMRKTVGDPVEPVEPDYLLLDDIIAEPRGKGSVEIKWKSSKPAAGQVEYGSEIPDYGALSPLENNPAPEHGITLTALEPGKRYVFRVISIGADGDKTLSGDFDFIAP